MREKSPRRVNNQSGRTASLSRSTWPLISFKHEHRARKSNRRRRRTFRIQVCNHGWKNSESLARMMRLSSTKRLRTPQVVLKPSTTYLPRDTSFRCCKRRLPLPTCDCLDVSTASSHLHSSFRTCCFTGPPEQGKHPPFLPSRVSCSGAPYN